jgi:hypothetical protein
VTPLILFEKASRIISVKFPKNVLHPSRPAEAFHEIATWGYLFYVDG